MTLMHRARLAALLAALIGLPVVPAIGQETPQPNDAQAETDSDGPAEAPEAGPEREIVIGAGAVAGASFPAAGAICRTVVAHNDGIRCLVESNGNSSANLERLQDGRLDFAIVQSDWLMHAARGTNLFRPNGPDETLRAVLSLYAESLTLVARADAGLASIGDLKGKRVNLGPPQTYQRLLTDAILKAAELDPGDLALADTKPLAEQFTGLCLGELDAATVVVSHPSPTLAEAMSRCDLRLVPVSGPGIEKLLSQRPELAPASIPAGLYVGAPDTVATIGLRTVLATTSQVDDEAVEAVARSIAENLPEMQKRHPALATIDATGMVSAGIALPIHDAARRVFQAKGLLK